MLHFDEDNRDDVEAVMSKYLDKTYIPLCSFAMTDSNKDSFGTLLQSIITRQVKMERGGCNSLSYLIGELLDNIYEHSDSSNGYVFSQFNLSEKAINLCIADTGITINGSYQKVYRAKIPPNAKKVVFSDGDNKKTDKITFTPGYGYYKNGIDTNSLYTVMNWNHAGTYSGGSREYSTYGDKIYIKADSSLIGNDKAWDNLHICFYKSDDTSIGLTSPGYLTSEPKTIVSDSWYEFEIPIGATNFEINNGSKDSTKTHYHKLENIAITPNAGYKIIENSGILCLIVFPPD